MKWVVLRRALRGEHADWDMRDEGANVVALEIIGVDRDDGERRLRQKVAQVSQSTIDGLKAACVVELAAPRTWLALNVEGRA